MRSWNAIVRDVSFLFRVDIRADVVSELIIIFERCHDSENFEVKRRLWKAGLGPVKMLLRTKGNAGQRASKGGVVGGGVVLRVGLENASLGMSSHALILVDSQRSPTIG
jgi:hypothetical protein